MKIESLSEFYDKVVFIMAYCPNFPNQEYQDENKFRNVDDAFSFLHTNMEFYGKKAKWKDHMPKLHEILDASYDKYKNGNNEGGMKDLLRFEQTIRGKKT